MDIHFGTCKWRTKIYKKDENSRSSPWNKQYTDGSEDGKRAYSVCTFDDRQKDQRTKHSLEYVRIHGTRHTKLNKQIFRRKVNGNACANTVRLAHNFEENVDDGEQQHSYYIWRYFQNLMD